MKIITGFIILVISIFLSLSIGMMDYETESLWHLLTSDRGNIVMLSLMTGFFCLIGFGILQLVKGIKGIIASKDMDDLNDLKNK